MAYLYLVLPRNNEGDLDAAVDLIRELPRTKYVGFDANPKCPGPVFQTDRALTDVEHQILGVRAVK